MTMIHTIAVLGGTGKVGKYVIQQALDQGYHVRTLLRNPEDNPVDSFRVEVVQGDATNEKAIGHALMGCDAVINILGRSPKQPFPYANVTRSIIRAMRVSGIRRYIGVTGASLGLPDDTFRLRHQMGQVWFRLRYRSMMKEKWEEYQVLQESSTDWTLIRLPFVQEGPVTKKTRWSLHSFQGYTITNGDVAAALIRQLHDVTYLKQAPFLM